VVVTLVFKAELDNNDPRNTQGGSAAAGIVSAAGSGQS
jgi:hypothetical protein